MSRVRKPVKEEKIRRWKGANNLPGSTSDKPGWKHPVMARAKVLCREWAVEQAGSDDALVMTTSWKEFGITGKALLAIVRKHLPQFDEVCKLQGRSWKTDSEKAGALSNRLWYMYRKRPKKGQLRKCVTEEHPLKSARLRPLVSEVSEMLQMGKTFRVAL